MSRHIFAEEQRIFLPGAHFEELLQDLLQAKFPIPQVYGMDTVIKKPNEHACEKNACLGPHNFKKKRS